MTSRQWTIGVVVAVALVLASLLFTDHNVAVFWLGVCVLIYLVLLKIELKAARLYLCFGGMVGGVILAFVIADFLLGFFVSDRKETLGPLLLMSPILSLAGGSLGFWVAARLS